MSRTQRRNKLMTVIATGALATVCTGAAIVSGAVDDKAAPRDMMEMISPEQQQAISSANGLSTAFRTVADHLLPSVVSIENRPAIAKVDRPSLRPSADPFDGRNPFEGTPFEDMFREFKAPQVPGGRLPEGRGLPKGFGQRMPQPGGIGSGVIIDADGIILTNNHVVAGGGEVTIKLQDGREYIASQVWTDPQTDLAVVKIDGATGLMPAKLGDSEAVAIGDWVVALGQPFGLKSTVTAGIISAKNRGIGITPRENFLQTDAAINPGNSGGPLVNLAGEVVGINTAIHSRGGGNDGIGFAVPSNLARWVSEQLIENGSVKRAYLGVGIQAVTPELAKEMGVDRLDGVLVTDVYEGTPAEKMKLQPGDIITAFGGKPMKTPQALQLAVERSAVGVEIEMEILRNGKAQTLTYVGTPVSEDFADRGSKPAASNPVQSNWGLEVDELSSDVGEALEMEVDRGVVVTKVADGTAADRAGLRPGMVIMEIDRKAVDSVEAFQKAMKSHDPSDESILLLVRTEKGSRFIVMKS